MILKYSEKTEKKIKTMLGITTASILALLFLAYMFLRILFWAETGSFFPTVQKSRSVEIAISCDPFDVLAVRDELKPYTTDYTNAGVKMIYAGWRYGDVWIHWGEISTGKRRNHQLFPRCGERHCGRDILLRSRG